MTFVLMTMKPEYQMVSCSLVNIMYVILVIRKLNIMYVILVLRSLISYT